MNKAEALAAIEERIKIGWRFTIDGDSQTWNCRAIGAGLAQADCGGSSFEAAVELALKHACAMEDDPQIVLSRYESTLKDLLIRVFGEKAFKGFKIADEYGEIGPKRIEYTIKPDWDAKTQVDKEEQFWKLSGHLPEEIQTPLRIKIEWPEETPEKKA